MKQLLPIPALDREGAPITAVEIRAFCVDGSIGECVACNGTTWSWWSPDPPQRFVPLHPRCAERLRELWLAVIAEGDTGVDEPVVAVQARRGAYARRAGAAVHVAERPVAARRGKVLPQGFTPGPYWKPGYDHLTPWVVLLSSAVGHVFCPFGENREAALTRLHISEIQRLVLHGVVTVGGCLIGPDGTVDRSWGVPPVVGAPRWEPVKQLSQWQACASCGTSRWPGSWISVFGSRCRSCVEPDEVADPRPWPVDPPSPGLMYAPEWLGGPKPRKARSKSTES